MQPSGRVVVTERGGVRGRERVAAGAVSSSVRQTTTLFTVVEDGREGRLVVATEVPYPQVAVLQDYATGRGYLAAGVQFQQVGTSLVVRPSVLPDGSIRVRLTPHISYLTATGGGDVEFTEASTELVVPSGRPIALAGVGQRLDAVTRQILGFSASQSAARTALTLVVTVE